MANLPEEVIDRAFELLNEQSSELDEGIVSFLREIARIDVVNLTPIQALVELDKIVRRCREILKE